MNGALGLLGAKRASGGLAMGTAGAKRVEFPRCVVAPAGFEPAISALRGLRPRPLDDGATLRDWWAALGLNQ